MMKTRPAAARQVTVAQLLGLSLAPAVKWLHRQMLQARLRSLQQLAEYFEWQEQNGRAGLSDTHKRIVLAKSDLAALTASRGLWP